MLDTEYLLPIALTEVDRQEILDAVLSYGDTAQLTEWGGGGSTVLWYGNLTAAQTVISIEDQPICVETVQTACLSLNDVPGRPQLEVLFYATEEYPDAWGTNSSYDNYVNGTDAVWNSDVYLVDGSARIRCALTIFERATKRGAVVYCHDYARNENHYAELLAVYPRWEIIDTPDTEYKLLKLWLE